MAFDCLYTQAHKYQLAATGKVKDKRVYEDKNMLSNENFLAQSRSFTTATEQLVLTHSYVSDIPSGGLHFSKCALVKN